VIRQEIDIVYGVPDKAGTLNNSASIVNEGADAVITNKCGGAFNNAGTVTGPCSQ
jgi:hypothetical protein